jgi:UDP-N-acetylmuramoyl-tripeptide--D-alanyl-D-alanine ligase
VIKRAFGDIVSMSQGEANRPQSDLTIVGVSKDTRTLMKGNLYIPLIGERFDGHDYVEEAFTKGARASLWQRDHANPPDEYPLIYVDDALAALQYLASAYLEQLSCRVIGVTGSNGKTTTKDLIASVLETTYQVHKTAGNYNGDIGLPLTILETSPDTDILVLEMGMRGRGEIEFLSKLAKPSAAVITNIGEAHLERLGSRDQIAKAKLEILSGLTEDGLFVYNGDEPLIGAYYDETEKPEHVRSCRFGLETENDLYPEGIMLDGAGTHFSINQTGERSYFIPLLGRHNVINALAAIAIGREFKVSEPLIVKGLRDTQPTGMRIELVKGATGLTILNDAYNASPTSVKAALELFKDLKGYARKIVVLGDMLELGPDEEQQHRDIGKLLQPGDFDYVYTYGRLAEWMADEAKRLYPTCRIQSFMDKTAIAEEISSFAIPQDIVLVKGSRGMRLEELVQALTVISL